MMMIVTNIQIRDDLILACTDVHQWKVKGDLEEGFSPVSLAMFNSFVT